MKNILFGILSGIGLLSAYAAIAHAEELYWGTIEYIRDGEVQIHYSSPGDDIYTVCSLDTYQCEEIDADEDIIPEGAKHLTRSPLNGWGIQLLPGNQSLLVYEIEDDMVSLSDTLMLPDSVITTRFGRGDDVLVILRNRAIDVYDLAEKSKKTFPYVADVVRNPLVSLDGGYLSFYTRIGVQNAYVVMNLESGTLTYVPAQTMDYLEVSGGGTHGAFIERDNKTTRLVLVDLSVPGQRDTVVSTENEIFDFLFVGDNLYYTTNDDDPYEWTLNRYILSKDDHEEIDSNISYIDYMKVVDGTVLYHKVNENVSEIKIYDPETEDTARLEGVAPEMLDRDLDRKEIELGGQSAVLLEKKRTDDDDRLPLVLWLHGGPERQTSAGYHPYLSYAVYDEILEKIAESGAARVLKLDYPGSWGYGRSFRDILQGAIGVADIEGIENALEEFVEEYKTSDVHPVGVSYGGYLALKLLVEDPDAFESATAINAVTDWRSLITRIPGSVFTPRFNGIPSIFNESLYQNADIFSSLESVDERTPILVAYGQLDTTVPPWQSVDFIARADNADLDIEVLSFDDEPHVIRERDNLNDLCEEMVDVMDLRRRVDCD